MTQLQKVEFITKLHWEENFTLRDIAIIFGRSYWWIQNFKYKNNLKVKKPYQSLMDKTGNRSVNWKGGKYRNLRDGYWMIFKPEHPNANHKGYVSEHRLVMSEKLKRPLKKDEVVHHIDGDKGNNKIDNLQIMTMGGRNKYHGIPLICPKCGYELKQNFLE